MKNEKSKSFKQFLVSPLGKGALIAVLYIVIMLLFGFLAEVIEAPIIAVLAAVAFAVCGWKVLNRITPDMFLFMSVTGWIVYFVVKGVLSVIIGVFVAPFFIAKKITSAIEENI